MFDARVLRRAFRDGRRFRITTICWLTAFVALAIAIFRTMQDSRLPYLIVPFVGVMMIVIRVAIHSVTEPRVRRLPETLKFESDSSGHADHGRGK